MIYGKKLTQRIILKKWQFAEIADGWSRTLYFMWFIQLILYTLYM